MRLPNQSISRWQLLFAVRSGFMKLLNEKLRANMGTVFALALDLQSHSQPPDKAGAS